MNTNVKGLFPIKIAESMFLLEASVNLKKYTDLIKPEITKLEKEYERLMKQIDSTNKLFLESDFLEKAPEHIVLDKYNKMTWAENKTDVLCRIIACLKCRLKTIEYEINRK